MDEQRDNRPPMVAYAAFEEMATINERHIKRLFVGLMVAIILLSASNMAWLWFWSGFDISGDYVEDAYTQEGEGRFNINTGSQGEIYYGETDLQESTSELPNDTP